MNKRDIEPIHPGEVVGLRCANPTYAGYDLENAEIELSDRLDAEVIPRAA